MAGHEADSYDIDGIQYARATSPLPAFANLQYSVDCAVAFAREKIKGGMPTDDALEAALAGWKDHSEGAKDTGKEAHDLFESYILKGEAVPSASTAPILNQFLAWKDAEVKSFLASEVRVVNKTLGYAGTVDCIYEAKDGRVVLGDFKTSSGFYPNYLLQCSAYLMALNSSKYEPAIKAVKCIRFPKDGSQYEVKEYSEAEIHRGCEAYTCYLRAYYLTAKRRLKNNPIIKEIWG